MNKLSHSLLLGISLFAIAACNNPAKDTSNDTPATGPEKTTSKPVKAPEAKGARRILFVGNSHTEYYISIPDMFDNLCKFNKNDIKEEKVVEMGISLNEIYADHKDKVDASCSQKDEDGNYYDYVVLQEKTPVAATNAAEYKASVKKFMAEIRKNSPGAVFLIYEVMSPADYDKEQNDYNQLYEEMEKTAQSVADENENTRLYRVSDAITDAYKGKNSYNHLVDSKDRLRFGDNTLHMLNDGGFLAATLLYATIFDKAPAIPEKMSLSTGTGDNDMPSMQLVKTAVSDPDALLKIAVDNK